MQYEAIILELMSRIKKLEEEVDLLKNTINGNFNKSQNDEQFTFTIRLIPEHF